MSVGWYISAQGIFNYLTYKLYLYSILGEIKCFKCHITMPLVYENGQWLKKNKGLLSNPHKQNVKIFGPHQLHDYSFREKDVSTKKHYGL